MTARRTTTPYRRNPAGELTARDEQIMRRWDNGDSIEQIAAATGLDVQKVYHIIIIWAEADQSRRARNKAARGCAMLRAAIEKYQRNLQPREQVPA